MRKHTIYSRPSIVDQVKKGLGTYEQAQAILAQLEKEGASSKTLKRLREAIENRVWA